jgi:hypothetical protein
VCLIADEFGMDTVTQFSRAIRRSGLSLYKAPGYPWRKAASFCLTSRNGITSTHTTKLQPGAKGELRVLEFPRSRVLDNPSRVRTRGWSTPWVPKSPKGCPNGVKKQGQQSLTVHPFPRLVHARNLALLSLRPPLDQPPLDQQPP